MAYTITPTPATGATITSRLIHQDVTGEKTTKVNTLFNFEGNYQLSMRAYESLGEPGIVQGSATQKFVISGQNVTPSAEGIFPKVGDFLLLAFTREHPVSSMAGTIITNEFMIIGPHPDLYDPSDNSIILDGGESFASAATRPAALGALVAWLEEALTVTVLKTQYNGGWSYDPNNSRFGSMNKQYDGV